MLSFFMHHFSNFSNICSWLFYLVFLNDLLLIMFVFSIRNYFFYLNFYLLCILEPLVYLNDLWSQNIWVWFLYLYLISHIQNTVSHVQSTVSHVQSTVSHVQSTVSHVQSTVSHVQSTVSNI